MVLGDRAVPSMGSSQLPAREIPAHVAPKTLHVCDMGYRTSCQKVLSPLTHHLNPVFSSWLSQPFSIQVITSGLAPKGE